MIRERSCVQKTACAWCAGRKNKPLKYKALTVLCNKITRARWPVGREDACLDSYCGRHVDVSDHNDNRDLT